MTAHTLALLGGTPAFPEPLHVGRPNLGDRGRLLARLEDILDRRWLSNHGPVVQEFERQISLLTGAPYCIAMCNATVALEIAARALGMHGEVIIPSFTFVATAHALQWQGLTPVFGDIDPETLCLDPRRLPELITPRTTGIVGVHVWGRPCAPAELAELAAQYELALLFDAAHAFGCSHQGRMIGNFGHAEVFSFHATKFLNSFEGGAVVTHDPDLAQRIRRMTNFGFAGYDQVDHLGTNGKMTEVAAAMGLTSLESMAEFVAVNHAHYQHYRRGLAALPGVEVVDCQAGQERHNYQYVVLRIDAARAGLTRDALMQALHAENVLARRYFYPGCHRMEPYRTLCPQAGQRLPVTERVVQETLLLPTGTALGAAEVATICALIRAVCAQAEAVQAAGRAAPA